MATTTNYGWTTPDDTDLVKDGASAIRTLGTSVDTTTKNLNPETTLGDLAFRSSTSNVKTRLGIGSSGQLLSVSGGVPAWATVSTGGMTLLTTHTLSGATSAITGISGDYVNLFALIFGTTNATTDGYLKVAPNGNNSISDFSITQGGSVAAVTDTLIPLANLAQTMDRTNVDNIFSLTIFGYASATARKTFQTQMGYIDINASGRFGTAIGYIKTNSAITSLTFSNTGGNLSAGTVLLYGVK